MGTGMGGGAGVFVCPRGHSSSEGDYCSECGARIGGGNASPPAPANADRLAGQACPDCGTAREGSGVVFCEVCGYNFVTGAHGEIPLPASVEAPLPSVNAEPAPEPVPDAKKAQGPWTVTVSVDASLRSPESPEAPADLAPFSVMLSQPVSLIGRHNEARGIVPELGLDHDEAVSRRHALLQMDPERGLLLRDIGAANGTRLNGEDLQPMVDYPLKDGDEITLGHWSRLRVHAG